MPQSGHARTTSLHKGVPHDFPHLFCDIAQLRGIRAPRRPMVIAALQHMALAILGLRGSARALALFRDVLNTILQSGLFCECDGYYPHPPVSFPTPCRSPGGGGSLGQPKIFRCGSLCCCVGGCVVGHYHLHPLHSWQDILLTFAEMELDSTTMFPPGTSVMFIRSTGEPVLAQVVGHSEHGDAYRRISYDRACKCACTVGVWSPRGGWGTVTW